MLDALLSVGRALVTGLKSFTAAVMVEVIREVERSPLGKVVAQGLAAFSDEYLDRSKELAREEAELATEVKRNGKTRDADLQRASDIAAAREELKRQYQASKAAEAATTLTTTVPLPFPSPQTKSVQCRAS